MSTTGLVAAQLMNKSASLLNDTAKEVYTYEAQLPYFQMALDELQEAFELNNIPVTMKTTSPPIDVDIGETEINPIEGVAPNYPSDLIEIEQLWERLQGSTDPYIPLTKRNYLPHYLADQPVNSLVFWVWEDQKIKFIGATTDREVKLDYIKAIFPDTDDVNENTVIGIINARSFLQYRTAGLCAEFIMENPTRAGNLNNNAVLAGERSMGISIKGKQGVVKRRRPFRAAFKLTGNTW